MLNQNLNLYHVFYTTAVCGNISSAAKELYISQPAISKTISKLENNLNTKLFFRNSRGVKLTPEGEILYHQLDSAFRSIRQGEDRIRKNLALGVGELSIGVSTTLCKYVLLPYLQTYIRENPYVKVAISCKSTYETMADLENGTLDIGFIGEPEKLAHLEFHSVQEINDIFVATKEYLTQLEKKLNITNPLQKEDARTLLSHSTLLLLDKNNITRQYIDKYLLLQDIIPEQQIEITTMDLVIEFAKIGLGAACVIGNFVEKELQEGTLVRLPVPSPIPSRKIGFAYKKQANPTVSMKKFMELLLDGENRNSLK